MNIVRLAYLTREELENLGRNPACSGSKKDRCAEGTFPTEV